jgi:hypothetical protein
LFLPSVEPQEWLRSELPGEVVLFSTGQNKAWTLDTTTDLVWCCCRDRSKTEVAVKRMQLHLGCSAAGARESLESALDRLHQEGLLQPAPQRTLTRRHFGLQIGRAAVFVPLVSSVLIPAPSAAASGPVLTIMNAAGASDVTITIKNNTSQSVTYTVSGSVSTIENGNTIDIGAITKDSAPFRSASNSPSFAIPNQTLAAGGTDTYLVDLIPATPATLHGNFSETATTSQEQSYSAGPTYVTVASRSGA